MLKDHQIKDAIIKSMIEADDTTYFNTESVSEHFNISIEKAYDLLKVIYTDRKSTLYKDYNPDRNKYIASPDAKDFLKQGGYTKIDRIEYWRNFPKNKWWLVDSVKFIGGAIFGGLITLWIQQLSKQEKELPQDSKSKQENTQFLDTAQKNVQQIKNRTLDSINK